MNIEIVDQIPAYLAGAPPKLIGIADDGAFGLVDVKTSPVMREGRQLQIPKPMLLSDAIHLAREIVAGVPRSITMPGVPTTCAVAVLAIAAQLGRMAMMARQAGLEAAAVAQPGRK